MTMLDAVRGRNPHLVAAALEGFAAKPRRLSPKWFYDDAGSIKYIDRNQEIHEDPAPMQMFIDRILAGIELLQKLQIEKPKIGAIADHAIKDYIAAIKKKLGS